MNNYLNVEILVFPYRINILVGLIRYINLIMVIRTALSLIVCLTPLYMMAQLSGSGAINNYAVFCQGSSNCIDNSNPIDTVMITAPDDGDLLVDVTFSETFIECCGPTTNFGINAALKSIGGSGTFFSFDNGANTGPHTLKCVKKDETFLLIFGGQKGNYAYTVTHITTEYGIDTEPNNDNSSATAAPLNVSQEGNVGYGIYSPNKDFRDWYRIAIDEDGDLEVDVTFNEPMNIILRRNTNNNSAIVTSNNAAPGQQLLVVECVAMEDTIFVELVARSNHCADYTFMANITNSPMGTNDAEPNNDIPSAAGVFNMPGDIEGRVRYGLNPQDGVDYFALGNMEAGDSLNFLIEAFKNPISVEISHSTGFPTINYNNVKAQQSHDLTITNPGLYYMKVTSAFNMCSEYKVIIDGRISNQRIDGVDLLSAANASGNLDISNSTVGPNSSNICAKCIRFCPIFVVPDGVGMTVNIKP